MFRRRIIPEKRIITEELLLARVDYITCRNVSLIIRRRATLRYFFKRETSRNSVSAFTGSRFIRLLHRTISPRRRARDRLLGVPQDTTRGRSGTSLPLLSHDPPSIIPQLLRKPRLREGDTTTVAGGNFRMLCRPTKARAPSSLSFSLSFCQRGDIKSRRHRSNGIKFANSTLLSRSHKDYRIS